MLLDPQRRPLLEQPRPEVSNYFSLASMRRAGGALEIGDFHAVRRRRNVHAASLLPGGEKDRMRGVGRWSLILKLPNPLTPPSPPRGEGGVIPHLTDNCPRGSLLKIG